MPIIKSAIKRARQSLVRRSRNLQTKRAVKADILAVHTAVTDGDTAQVQEKLAAAYSEIDRAVKKHTLHKNTAARRKSQLAATVAKAASAAPAEAPKTTKGAGAAAKKTTAKKAVAPKAKALAAKKAPAKKTTDK
jgi:small subunit ribosomal protein S20